MSSALPFSCDISPDAPHADRMTCDEGDQGPRWPSDETLLAALIPWMEKRRWFPLKDRGAQGTSVLASWDLAPGVRDHLLAVPTGQPDAHGDGAGSRDGADETDGDVVLVHVPLVLDEAGALARLTHEGEADGVAGTLLDETTALVDGPHHPMFWRAWSAHVLAAGTVMGEGARHIGSRAPHLRVITGEQSNTSVILPAPHDEADGVDETIIVKVFRVVAQGRNPEVEVSVALANNGWDRVSRPIAWSTLSWESGDSGTDEAGARADSTTDRLASADPPVHHHVADSAVASVFIPNAQVGFDLFCSLAGAGDREASLSLARDLGTTTAQMHTHLAQALGVADPGTPAALAQALRERATWALSEVPELTASVPSLAEQVEAALARLEALSALPPACRVHGDYHLGQVLHAAHGWYVLDFEGEPLRPLAQRVLPDQPLRDVAGMLRSFDYAAAVGHASDEGWLPAVRAAYTQAYDEILAPTPGITDVLLNALELDKALYEAVYEARNRPDWLTIPLSGLTRLLSQ